MHSKPLDSDVCALIHSANHPSLSFSHLIISLIALLSKPGKISENMLCTHSKSRLSITGRIQIKSIELGYKYSLLECLFCKEVKPQEEKSITSTWNYGGRAAGKNVYSFIRPKPKPSLFSCKIGFYYSWGNKCFLLWTMLIQEWQDLLVEMLHRNYMIFFTFWS